MPAATIEDRPPSVGDARPPWARALPDLSEVFAVGYWQVDLVSGARVWSDEVYRLYGLAPGAPPPSTEAMIAAYHPEDRPHVEAAVRGARLRRGPYAFEGRIQRPDGSLRSVLVRGSIDRDEADRPRLAYGTILDLTTAATVEAQRREAVARLETTLDTMDQGLVMVDAEGHLAVVNRRASALLGLDPDFLAGRPHFHEVREAQRRAGEFDHAPSELRTWLLGNDVRSPSPVYERTRPNGTVLEVRSVSLPQGGVVRTYTEITARRQAEAALREQRQLLTATLENMDQGLMMIDAAGILQICNERAITLLGLPPALARSRPSFAQVVEFQRASGEFADCPGMPAFCLTLTSTPEEAPQVYERTRPNGTVLEVRTVRLAEGGLVRTFTDVTERKAAEARVSHMARHDALTTLPNRSVFRETFERHLGTLGARGTGLAVLCLDLDRFKAVNDALGHPAGDRLLEVMAVRLKGLLRGTDLVARLGGDEFVILQTGGVDAEAAQALAGRLLEAIARPVEIEGTRVTVGASIGIALAPLHGTDADLVFRRADLALYRAKAEGRNAARLFEPAMEAAVEARQRLALDLRLGLQRGEFRLHYQPIVDATDGRVVAQEALLRWQHPVRGLVPPGEFIPLAEEIGVIGALGEWVLRTALRDARHLPPLVRVAVNVSAAQVRRPGLAATVRAALDAAGLEGSRLEIEITESLLIDGEAEVRAELQALRASGVRIALDDFGTGYSSLSYLRRFPFDKIKIDRSFVADIADPETAAIVRSVVGLAASLGKRVTAEGIETGAQLAAVRAAGCDEAQGYLLGRPVPLALAPPSDTGERAA